MLAFILDRASDDDDTARRDPGTAHHLDSAALARAMVRRTRCCDMWRATETWRRALMLIAEMHADHADFRAEWRTSW